MEKYLVTAQHYDMAVGLEVWLVREATPQTEFYGKKYWLVTTNPDKVVPDDGYLRIIPDSKLEPAP
jgi:hypothetical protein